MEVQHKLVMKVPKHWGTYVVASMRAGRAFQKVNKNACTSIMAGIIWRWPDSVVITRAEFAMLEKYRALELNAMVRDPWKRVESTYRWLVAQPEGHRLKRDPEVPCWRLPFADWVLHLCCDREHSWGDDHFKLQAELLYPEGAIWPDVLIPWDFTELARRFDVDRWTRENVSDPLIQTRWTPKAIEAYRQWAAPDFVLWDYALEQAKAA